MATYTKPTISNYNDNPPTNDGSTNFVDNGVDWDKNVIDEVGDPLNNYSDSINNETLSGFNKTDAARTISVTDYGAIGDGATDDTAAIQAAITAIQNDGDGGRVFLPNGEYKITSELIMTGAGAGSLIFEGEGWGTQITISGTGKGIKIGNVSADQTAQIIISRLRIDGSSTSSYGIHAMRMHNLIVQDVRVQSCNATGLYFQGCYASFVRRSRSSNNTGNGFHGDNISPSGVDWTTLQENAFLANGENGVYFDCTSQACAGVRILNNDIEGNAVGIRCDVGSSGNSEAWAIDYNYLESQHGLNMQIGADGGSGFFRTISISSNIVNQGQGASAAINGVELDHIQGALICGNLWATADVTVTAATNIGMWTANINSGGSNPTGFVNSNSSVESLAIRQDASTFGSLSMASGQIRVNQHFGIAGGLFPSTVTSTPGYQTECALYAGDGAPDNAHGAPGDFYFRGDGGVGAYIYWKNGASWAVIV